MAGVPETAHYRESDDPDVCCASCLQYESGFCRMFETDVGPTMVCDEWEQIVSDHANTGLDHWSSGMTEEQIGAAVAQGPPEGLCGLPSLGLIAAGDVARVPAAELNRLLQEGYRRAEELEPRLARILQPILEQAGLEAARRFEIMATDHLSAAATKADVTATSAMVALYPTGEQAFRLAEEGGEPAELMHITLCYLGKDVSEEAVQRLSAALGVVAATHPPLEGHVGGLGSFADFGNGYPSLLLPDVPGLVELRHAVCEAAIGAGLDYPRDHGYLPHLTVAYRDGGPELADASKLGEALAFGALHVVYGNDQAAVIPLTGTPALTASGLSDVAAEVSRVAQEVAVYAEPDYGFTFWHEGDGKVFWVCADYTSADEIDYAVDAFAAIPGVNEVEACAECGDPSGEGWVQVPSFSALTAAAHPGWSAPAGDEILDVAALVSTLRTKTDPVRQKVVETMMTPVLAGAGLAFDVHNPLTAKVLAQAGSQVTGIAATTQLNVMRVIRKAHEEGLTIPDTAKAIRAGMKQASAARATLIARTEIVGAVNGGSLAAVQIVSDATGAKYTKVWLTSPGAQYPRHEDYDGLDGQTVDLDGSFDVGGDALEFPGDPSGSAEEVCNCRCTMVYDDGEGEQVADADAGELPTVSTNVDAMDGIRSTSPNT